MGRGLKVVHIEFVQVSRECQRDVVRPLLRIVQLGEILSLGGCARPSPAIVAVNGGKSAVIAINLGGPVAVGSGTVVVVTVELAEEFP
jgi:hypothetical protein